MFSSLSVLFLPKTLQEREETSQRITWGHWFTLFNVVLSLLIASRYAFNADWPNTLLGKLYFFISLFGHFSFVVFAFYLLLLFPLSFLLKNNHLFRAVSVVIATFGQSVLLVDTEVFSQFYLHLSPLVWDLLVNPDEGELSRQWQLLFVPMPLILLLEMLYSRWCWNKLRGFSRQRWGKWVALWFVCCFIGTHLIYAAADMTMYRPVTAQKANYPLSSPMTARSFLEKHGLINASDFQHNLQEQGRLDTFYLNYPKAPLQFSEQQPSHNIIMVNLSGLSPAQIRDEAMPNLVAIQQQSKKFVRHYSSGDSAASGILNLFYSLTGRYLDAVLREQVASPLIARLMQADYQFGLFSYNGFDQPIYRRALFKGFKLPKAKDNAEAMSQWNRWLKQRSEKPFFSYLELKADEKLDQHIGTLWLNMVKEGLTPNTLLIMTADMAHSVENRFDPARIQVPLFIYWQAESGQFEELSSHLDLMPTIMKQWLQATTPISDYAQGMNLYEPITRKWLLSSNFRWNVAILPRGEQYRLDRKGDVEYYNSQGEKVGDSRPPLALFLQLLQQSNYFVEK